MTTMELIEKRGIGFNCLSDAYDLGRADYEKECEELFNENPPMHFTKEQIMWIVERMKLSRRDGIIEFSDWLYRNHKIDLSEYISWFDNKDNSLFINDKE